MKITTELLPKRLLSLNIELDQDQFEKGLNRAAQRLSQKYSIPGFRKGKAPRFIVENYLGREAIVEEASEDLVKKSLKEAFKQEEIIPVGPPTLESIDTSGAFSFRVIVPLAPTFTLPDYRTIRIPLDVKPVTDEMIQRALDMLRDKHVALKELDEPRPAQQGDQLTVRMDVFKDDEPLDDRDEDEDPPETNIVLEPDRLVPELYEGLLGVQAGDQREITATMPDDHENEDIRGQEVTFDVQVVNIQERILPEWDELPALEDSEGTIDDLRQEVTQRLEESVKNLAERNLVNTFIDQLISQGEFDIADVTIDNVAEEMLNDYARDLSRYGITLEQMLQYRDQSREQALEEMRPSAELQFKTSMALMTVAQAEELFVSEPEIEDEVQNILKDYEADQHDAIVQALSGDHRADIAHGILNRKLQARIIAIATGEVASSADTEPATSDSAEEESAPQSDEPATSDTTEEEPASS